MSGLNSTFEPLFKKFGFSDTQVERALALSAEEDISSMSDEQVAANKHITTSRQTTRWQLYFEYVHKEAFKQRFGDALIKLGYEESNRC